MIILFLVLLLIPIGILLLPFSMKKKVSLLLSLVVVAGIAAVVSPPYLHKNAPLFNLFFPPADLYDPLATTTFSTTGENSSCELDFTAKYPGRHTVTVIPSVPIETMGSYGEDFSVRVVITSLDGEVLLDEERDPPFSQFWGKECGMHLFAFNASEDVPQDVQLHALVQIKKADNEFEEKFGPITLSIKKGSDE